MLNKIQEPENLLRNVYSKINKQDKISFLSGFIFCLLVNMFMYTNTNFIHDSVRVYDCSNGLQNGRFFVNVLFVLTDRFQSPWLIGLLTCLFIGLTMVFLTRLLNYKSTIGIILISGILVCHPTLITSHLYFSSTFMYCYALFASVLGVYLFDKCRLGFLTSFLLFFTSVSTYQAYMFFAICLVLVKIIQDIQLKKIEGKTIIIKCLKYAVCVVTVLIVYFISWKLLMNIFNVPELAYRGYDNLSENSINLFSRICSSFVISIGLLFKNAFDLPLIAFISWLLLNILGVSTTLFTYNYFSKKHNVSTLSFLCIVFLNVVMVFSMSAIFCINPAPLHSLMVFSTINYILLLFSNIEIFLNKKNESSSENIRSQTKKIFLKWTTFILSCLFIFSMNSYANTSYTYFATMYNNSISYSTRLIDRIEQIDGFEENTKIIFTYSNPEAPYTPYKQSEKIFTASHNVKTVFNLGEIYNGAITYPDTLIWFLTDNMNMPWDVSIDKVGEYSKLSVIQDLEYFPKTNCYAWVDDVLIIKLPSYQKG